MSQWPAPHPCIGYGGMPCKAMIQHLGRKRCVPCTTGHKKIRPPRAKMDPEKIKAFLEKLNG